MKHSYLTPKRFVVIDDDLLFVKILAHAAQEAGVIIDGYASLENVLSESVAEKYDAAIVDYDLGTHTGVQAIKSLQARLGCMPVLLVSAKPRKTSKLEAWPASVKRFLVKSSGYNQIIDVAKSL